MRYILFLLHFFILFPSFNSYAQNPGAIEGHKLWLIGDQKTTRLINKNYSEVNATHFNFNPIINLQSDKKTLFKNIVSEQYSLFTVFKSDFEEERIVVNINRGRTSVLVTNKEVLNDKEIVYEKVNSRNGFILSYLNGNNDKNGKKRNSLSIDELFGQDKEGKEQLMELIYFPMFLNDDDRQKIQTYLSIKYGISILGDSDYLNSQSEKVWDAKENKTFSNRVTGVGRDDAYGLYQKQSGNAEKDGLYIGLGIIDTTNAKNKYEIKDRSFILWGDNSGKKIFLEDKNNKLKKLGRVWKMQFSGLKPHDSIKTQLKINKKEFGYINNNPTEEFLWLSINEFQNSKFDYVSAKYIKQSSEDEEYIYFNTVNWDKDGNGTDLFTFVKAPDFSIENESNYRCIANEGTIALKIIGGTPPYIVSYDDVKFEIEKNYYEFTTLSKGEYKIKVTESKGKTESIIAFVDPFKDLDLSIAPLWYIGNSGEVVVLPSNIEYLNFEDYSFEWKKGNRTLSTAKEFTSDIPGDYVLSILSTEGCSKNIPFTIENRTKDMVSGWKLYPNPIKIAENFSINFNLDKESKATVRINSMEGKLVLFKQLGTIKDFEYQDTLITAGVYLVTVTIGDTSETVKLIVH